MLHEALQLIHHNSQQHQLLQQQQQQHQLLQQQQQHHNHHAIPHHVRNMHSSMPHITNAGGTNNFGSSVAVHKLRESKWFTHNETKIFLSVVETGFILEKRTVPDDGLHQWGIALWKCGQEKSKNMDYLTIYTLVYEKNKPKLIGFGLNEFWLLENEIRINNQNDKDRTPNGDDDVRKQIEHSKKNKNMKWHNSQHFVYWCRYEKPICGRVQQISERVKWNSIGVSIGMLMMKPRTRRTTIN